MDDIKDRFRLLMEREGLTAGAFAECIGASQATISHILSGRNKPSVELILRIHQRYEDINLEWLLTGKGNMNNASDSTSKRVEVASDYPLFAENTEIPPQCQDGSKNRKEMPLKDLSNQTKEVVKQEIVYKERPSKKITEIRIFFDDNTYEIFKPSN